MKYFPEKLIILCVFLLVSSCGGIKYGGVKSGKKLYETFFVGEEGTQYFIKPLIFDKESGEKLELDLTFRYKNEVKDSVTVNFSFLGTQNLKDIDSLKISNSASVVIFKEVKYMFSERKKELYRARFTGKCHLSAAANIFGNAEWNLIIYKKDDLIAFKTPKSTKNKIDKLKYEIFALF